MILHHLLMRTRTAIIIRCVSSSFPSWISSSTMKAFTKALFLALAATSASAQLSPSIDANTLASSSGDELEFVVMDELLPTAGSRDIKDSKVVFPVTFGGLRATGGNSNCLGPGDGSDPYRPRPVRDGARYRFNVQKNVECRDVNNLSYEWGEFTNVNDTTECAEKCVNTAPETLVIGGAFRGFEFVCSTKQCRCLYDAGTLSTRSSRGFNRSKTNQGGKGSITNFPPRTDHYCAKLVGAELLEIAIE
ncbi:hypothetical protein ACHAXA_004713 [Cyclostephanos tholiformis]|uniref:WSC domain-containing protein n=1 Tax=Cyclostephanos tholiformis TaxID=382380 RepID=A0ABD3SSL3_9STRA